MARFRRVSEPSLVSHEVVHYTDFDGYDRALYNLHCTTFHLAHDPDGSVRVVMRDVDALYSFRPDTLELETTVFAGASLLQKADGRTIVVDPDLVLPNLAAANSYSSGFVVLSTHTLPTCMGLSRSFPDGSSTSRDPLTGALTVHVPEANSITTAEPDGTYKVVSPSGTTRRFDAAGVLTQADYRSGLRMMYDPTGRAYDVHLPDGVCVKVAELRFEIINVKDLVQEGVAPGVLPALVGHLSFEGLFVEKNAFPAWHLAPNFTLEGYDSSGHLCTRAYADGRIQSFDGTGALVRTSFADGSVSTPLVDGSTRTVNAAGDTIGICTPDGIEAQLQGDGTWRLARPDGSVTDYLADGNRLETRNGIATLYRADGTRARRTDAAGTTEYDLTGIPVAYTSSTGVQGHFIAGANESYLRIMDDGSEATLTADDILQRTVSAAGDVALYDASGRRMSEIDAFTGIFTRFVYTPDGRFTGTRSDLEVDTYDSSGVLQRSVLADGTRIDYPNDGVTAKCVTYPSGLVVSDGTDGSRTWQQPGGTVTTRAAGGALTTVNAASQSLVTTQHADNTLKIGLPDGTWTFIHADGSIEHDAADAITLIDRIDVDGTRTVVENGLKTVTHRDGSYEVTTLDEAPVRAHRADGSETRYNSDGSQVEVSPSGTVLSVTLQDGRTATWDATEGTWKAVPGLTITTFHADGTLLSEVTPDGQVKTCFADGSYVVTGTDQPTTTYRVDGTMARQVYPGGDDITYDASGTAVQTVHEDLTITRFNQDGSTVEFSSTGTLLSVTLADGTAATWNDVNSVWEATSSLGVSSRYDADGKLLSTAAPTGRLTTYTANGSYDVTLAGTTTSYRADGTRARYVNGNGDETLYDGRGQIHLINHADTSITRYEADRSKIELTSTGTVLSVKLSDGTAATWDATASAWQATSSNGAVTLWNADGVLLSRTSSDGNTVTTYDADGSSVLTAPGSTTWYRADGTAARMVAGGEETLYDEKGSPIRITHADQSVTRTNPDGSTVELTSTGTVTAVRLQSGQATTWDVRSQAWIATTADAALVRYNPDGSLFSTLDADGLLTTFNPDHSYMVIGTDNSTTFYRADGTEARAIRDGDETLFDAHGVPTQTNHSDGSVTTYGVDGSALQRAYADHVDHFHADGSTVRRGLDTTSLALILPDGTTAATHQSDGTWTGTATDQTAFIYSAEGAVLHIAYSDGTTVQHRSDGAVETHGSDSSVSIEYADGTWTSTDADGTVTVGQADGSSVATRQDETQVVTFADGTVEDHQVDGTTRITLPDGTQAIRYQDGTRVAWPAEHVVVTTRTDGEIITRDANGHVFTQESASAPKVQLSEQGSLSIACTGGPTLSWLSGGTMRTAWSDGSLLDDYPGGKQVMQDGQGTVTTTFTSGLRVVTRQDTSRSVTCSDGTLLEVAASGAITLTIPDGSQVHRVSLEAPPVFTPAEGSTAILQADGSLMLPSDDGSSTTAWMLDGSVVETSGGTVTTRGTDGTTVTLESDGSGTSDDGNGTTSTTSAGGEVVITSYDGSQTVQQTDGITVTTEADGRIRRVMADGTTWDTAPDSKTLTATLTDGSVVTRAANGAVTAAPAEASTQLSQDADGRWVAQLPSGDVVTWAADGSGTLTTVQLDQSVVVRKMDGSVLTTYSDHSTRLERGDNTIIVTGTDGTRVIQTPQERYVRLMTDSRVVVQSDDGSRTLLSGDGTAITRGADGSLLRSTAGADGGAGSTQIWRTDGSVERDSADHSTFTENPDGSTDYSWPDGTRLHVNKDGSYDYILANGQHVHGAAGDYPLDENDSFNQPVTDPQGNNPPTPPEDPRVCHLPDGSTQFVDDNGKVTRTYPNGIRDTRTPDGTVTRWNNGTITTWHADGSVEVRTPEGRETWDSRSGWYTKETRSGNTTIESNGMVTEDSNGHRTITLPSGAVIRDGQCSLIYDIIDGKITYHPYLRYAMNVGYSPPNPPFVVMTNDYNVPEMPHWVNSAHKEIVDQSLGLESITTTKDDSHWESTLITKTNYQTYLVPAGPGNKPRFKIEYTHFMADEFLDYVADDNAESGLHDGGVFSVETTNQDTAPEITMKENKYGEKIWYFEVDGKKYFSDIEPKVTWTVDYSSKVAKAPDVPDVLGLEDETWALMASDVDEILGEDVSTAVPAGDQAQARGLIAFAGDSGDVVARAAPHTDSAQRGGSSATPYFSLGASKSGFVRKVGTLRPTPTVGVVLAPEVQRNNRLLNTALYSWYERAMTASNSPSPSFRKLFPQKVFNSRVDPVTIDYADSYTDNTRLLVRLFNTFYMLEDYPTFPNGKPPAAGDVLSLEQAGFLYGKVALTDGGTDCRQHLGMFSASDLSTPTSTLSIGAGSQMRTTWRNLLATANRLAAEWRGYTPIDIRPFLYVRRAQLLFLISQAPVAAINGLTRTYTDLLLPDVLRIILYGGSRLDGLYEGLRNLICNTAINPEAFGKLYSCIGLASAMTVADVPSSSGSPINNQTIIDNAAAGLATAVVERLGQKAVGGFSQLVTILVHGGCDIINYYSNLANQPTVSPERRHDRLLLELRKQELIYTASGNRDAERLKIGQAKIGLLVIDHELDNIYVRYGRTYKVAYDRSDIL